MKKLRLWLLTAAGFALINGGFLMIKTISDPTGILITLPYILIGVGSGAFGAGAAELFSQRLLKNHPEEAKRQEIEKNDERNLAVANRAKGKAYDRMVTVFGALMLCFALTSADLTLTLTLVFAYLFVIACRIYYQCKFEKEM